MAATRKLTDDQEKDVIEMYLKKIPVTQILSKYNISRSVVQDSLKRNNIQPLDSGARSKYKVNENFFDVIDSEAKAYFLGMMYADGCVSSVKNSLKIELQSDDIDILNKLKTTIEFTGPILTYEYYREANSVVPYGGQRSTSQLLIFHKKLKQDLIKHGCHPKKTMTLEFPTTVPHELMRHFLRGFIDGDGSIWNSPKHKTAACSFISTINFCKSAMAFIQTELNIGGYFENYKRSDGIGIYGITGSNQFLKFTDWLYKDATIYMERKYNKYMESKKLILENQAQTPERMSKRFRGEKNWSSKVTEDIVKQIRHDFEQEMSIKNLSIKYNMISYSGIQAIVHRKSWKHI